MKNVKITRTDDIDYLQFNRLLEFEDRLVHAIFLKNHNIGFNLGNNLEVREKSIDRISKEFNINKNIIVQSHQTHSSNINIFSDINTKKTNILSDYDGFITDIKRVATIITFADCIPVFIYDPKNNVYANIHSGWRGIINGIAIKGINELVKKYNSNIKNLICCIGPNIRKECFLVNKDLVDIYVNTYNEKVKRLPIIEKTDLKNEKGIQYRIDNNLLLKELLKEIGILDENIIDSCICTVCKSNDFHSRRAEGENFQKCGGLMMLK